MGVPVAATEAALEVIRHLEAAHGPLMFFQSGGCCDGTSPMCLVRERSYRVSAGAAEGFSLEGLAGVHFVTRTVSHA
jgi:uncharacterized protein (DUF779 family)